PDRSSLRANSDNSFDADVSATLSSYQLPAGCRHSSGSKLSFIRIGPAKLLDAAGQVLQRAPPRSTDRTHAGRTKFSRVPRWSGIAQSGSKNDKSPVQPSVHRTPFPYLLPFDFSHCAS